MTRTRLAATAIVLWALLVLAWSTGMRPGDPWHASQTRILDGHQLASIAGDGTPAGEGLRVSDLGPYRQALQSWQLDSPIDAGQTPVLFYRVHDFPRKLELALIFRTRQDPDNVHSVTLPWPPEGVSAIDLSILPDWQGEITELGFSEYPMPGQSPPDAEFAPFLIQGARVQSRSLAGLWQVSWTRWMGWNAWSMRSINANRASAPYPVRGSLNLMLALWLAGAGLLALVFGLLRGRGGRVLLAAVILAWLLLDVRWLSQMQRNHALAGVLFQDKPWSERSRLIADRPLQQRAELMSQVLARQQSGVHVLYWTPSQVDSVRLGYFLRPHNVAALPPGMDASDVPDGTLLLIDNQDMSWQWDAYHSRLSRSSYRIQGDLLWRRDDMLLLSVRRGAGP